MTDEERFASAESEEQILARLHRRIRGAQSHPAKPQPEERYLIGPEERYWSNHLGDLVNETLSLGLARNIGLQPLGTLMHDAFVYLKPLSLGYIHMAGHVNDLALQQWAPTSTRARAKFDALIELHGRALVLLEEICLLSFSGYPSGASALSRTLHEVRITARLLERFEARLSERYLASHTIDLWQGRSDYTPSGPKSRSNAWKVTEAEMRRRFEETIEKHGESMLIANGWAWPRLQGRYGYSEKVPRHIPFSKLQAAAGIAHDRQRYRTASHRVHGGRLGSIATLMGNETGVALLGPRPFRLDVAATEALWDTQRVTESLLRTCGKMARERSIYYWLEALDQNAYVMAGLFGEAQVLLDRAFEPS